MRLQLQTVPILFLLPMLALGQSAEPRIQTQNDLVSMLCRAEESGQSREQLLVSHPQLVNADLWNALTSRAVAAYYSSSPEQSLATYYIAIQVARRLNNPRLLATTYYNLGRTYSGLNQIPKAIQAYESSRTILEEARLQTDLTYILADLGLLYFIQEDYPRAAKYSEQSLSLSETAASERPAGLWPPEYGKATALATLANLDMRDGNFDQAIEKLNTSLLLYEQLNRAGSDFRSQIAGDLQAVGRAYTSSGDYAQALRYLTDASKIIERLSDEDSVANLLNSIGVLYLEQEDYPQARRNLENALQIYRRNRNQKETARVLLNLGVVEQRQSNYEQAFEWFKSSLEAAKSAQVIDVTIAATEGLAVVLTGKKDYPTALLTLSEGERLAKELGDKVRQTELKWRMAQTYYEMGRLDQAVSCAEEAVALGRASYSHKLIYLATTTLGETYAAQDKIELAAQTLKRAVEQLESMRDQVAGNQLESQLYFENKIASYHSLVDALVKQGKPLDALLYAERAKGRVLLDVLRGGKPDLAKLLTPDEKAETQRLNRRISEINDTIRKQQSANSSTLNSLYAQLDSARLEYQSFQDGVYATHPELKIRSGQPAAITAADLNALTSDGSSTAYLEYVAAKDRVFLFVLTRGKSDGTAEVRVYPIAAKPDELVRKVNQFHDALAEHQPSYGKSGSELYRLLVAPAEQQLRNIETFCIVPDSFLWNVPFQALMSESDRFLIEDHAVYYVPSLSVLREMNRRIATTRRIDLSLIAFGNPVIGKDEQRNTDVCPLPEAEQEVTSIAKSFDAKTIRVFIGRDATEKTFKALAPTYSIVHLATHGVIDNRQPLYSHLLLTKTEGDPENDGRLEARQIMDMNLRADLAVLSACETANGRIAPGEGVIGLSWAFFVAGTRSMLVSQWKINSASTSELMTSFYKNLNSDNAHPDSIRVQALRHASVEMIKDQRNQHPFYWASIVLVGAQ